MDSLGGSETGCVVYLIIQGQEEPVFVNDADFEDYEVGADRGNGFKIVRISEEYVDESLQFAKDVYIERVA